MTTSASVEIGTFSKSEKLGSVPIPGTADMSRYEDVLHRLSVVETYEDDAPVISLRVEIITCDEHATAARPRYRVAIDIPLEGNAARMIQAAADRAAEPSRPSLVDAAVYPGVGGSDS